MADMVCRFSWWPRHGGPVLWQGSAAWGDREGFKLWLDLLKHLFPWWWVWLERGLLRVIMEVDSDSILSCNLHFGPDPITLTLGDSSLKAGYKKKAREECDVWALYTYFASLLCLLFTTFNSVLVFLEYILQILGQEHRLLKKKRKSVNYWCIKWRGGCRIRDPRKN